MTMIEVTAERRAGEHPRRPGRRLLLIAAPLAFIVAAALHPAGEDTDRLYEDIAAVSGRWLGVHLAQLVLCLGIAATLWFAVRGRRGAAPTVARVAIPVYLVFFTAFDAVAGIATGIAVRHAGSLSGAERVGAAKTAEHLLLNHVAGDFSPLAAISTVALTSAIVGVAMTFRAAGARRAVWVSALGGVLLNFHAAGVVPIAGLAALACSLYLADRDGLIA